MRPSIAFHVLPPHSVLSADRDASEAKRKCSVGRRSRVVESRKPSRDSGRCANKWRWRQRKQQQIKKIRLLLTPSTSPTVFISIYDPILPIQPPVRQLVRRCESLLFLHKYTNYCIFADDPQPSSYLCLLCYGICEARELGGAVTRVFHDFVLQVRDELSGVRLLQLLSRFAVRDGVGCHE